MALSWQPWSIMHLSNASFIIDGLRFMHCSVAVFLSIVKLIVLSHLIPVFI